MIPLSRTPVWSPVESEADLEITVIERHGEERVEVIVKETSLVLLSLTRDDALKLADDLYDKGDEPVREDIGGWLSGPGL